MVLTGKIKKWGNSFGIRITKEEMKKRNLHNEETIIFDIKKNNLEELFGICHFKKPVKQLIKDIKEGYDD